MAGGRVALINKRKLTHFRFRPSTIETMEEVAKFLGIDKTEVLEQGLNRLFEDVNETVSDLMSGDDLSG